ncbi:hypothetical protein WL94_23355 [Burkholderia cepacia]|uniref:T6SS effector phospholipase Tle3 domain-containing protein n=1 Tax=Burkholderia cepacia TaxID=292 RepID=UPI00075D0D73|nr:DUF3274 domain-containing protein [Burkholderia cepacia]KWF83376.1 hypothetical protein WL94_23355 [Burkholderia cepacia]
MTNPSTPAPGGTQDKRFRVGGGKGITTFSGGDALAIQRPALPGVVIFVHGVNSEGEWFKPAEEGLCKGLNRRLGRLDDQMAHKGVEGGQLTPAQYIDSLTPDGFINPKMTSKTYIQATPSYSPVIHFRWGYKANKDELKKYGANVFLNEQNYWGGGPFANGCSSLPDMYNEGVNDRLFGWLRIQSLNSISAREVYSTPPRHYGVMAALRLAKLIESIRRKQADMPITVVCHSQGNMVGILGAFLGDQLQDVTDVNGKKGRCVADTYVLANPPYSVMTDDMGGRIADSWSQRGTLDKDGRRGRETYQARVKTLGNFLNIIGARRSYDMDAAYIDKHMENSRPSASGGKPFKAALDRQHHGLNGSTYGRATLYCCPHDQVISAVTVQGMGWRGLSDEELRDIGVGNVLTQRVFASGYHVGLPPGARTQYRYWEDDWRYGKGATPGFWYPPSPTTQFSFRRTLLAANSTLEKAGIISSYILGNEVFSLLRFVKTQVNGNPPKGWAVTISAPKLDEPFKPQAIQYGHVCKTTDGPNATSDFNEYYDPPATARQAKKPGDRKPGDALDNYDGKAPALGDAKSEAEQRYEDHAIVRQRIRRLDATGFMDKEGRVKTEEPGWQDPPQQGGLAPMNQQIMTDYLKSTEKNNPTNHSTTMTNPAHAEKALAYDVAVGVCKLDDEAWKNLRVEADWRFGGQIGKENANSKYGEYFLRGLMQNGTLAKWISHDGEARMPSKIVDERDGWMIIDGYMAGTGR